MVYLVIMFIFLLIALLMFMINMLISKKEFMDREKVSTFECGFVPLSVNRLPFSVNFFIISLLFLIFDVEVVFLFPMVMLCKLLMFMEFFFLCYLIMIILYLGLEFEKGEGSLKWNL